MYYMMYLINLANPKSISGIKNNLRNHSQINPTNFQQISGIKDQSHESFISLTNHDETTPRNQKSMSGTMKPVILLFLNSLAFFLISLSIATLFLDSLDWCCWLLQLHSTCMRSHKCIYILPLWSIELPRGQEPTELQIAYRKFVAERKEQLKEIMPELSAGQRLKMARSESRA